ncbi:MAG: N(4)-(beta-N-acetylglucosaminyl)-L-asparaginase [Cyclobacteriaceae bacterium]
MRKMKRRAFVKTSALGVSGLAATKCAEAQSQGAKPLMISTWDHGHPANEIGWEILQNGGAAIDAVEQGVKVVEADPNSRTVGIGGLPDREGKVTLDACIMKGNGDCGAVAFLQDIKHPIAVARKVMEETPHIMLVGRGAKKFAIDQGFQEENLLTQDSERDWKEWLKESKYQFEANIENHDTIGSLSLDGNGLIAGACTTSGAAYKMHGRVGDSPIIGAGLFVDGEVGAACATGTGEAVIRTAGSAMVVEQMRMGKSPRDACTEVIKRIARIHQSSKGLQVGFLAINKEGEYVGIALLKGFTYAIATKEGNKIMEAEVIG